MSNVSNIVLGEGSEECAGKSDDHCRNYCYGYQRKKTRTSKEAISYCPDNFRKV